MNIENEIETETETDNETLTIDTTLMTNNYNDYQFPKWLTKIDQSLNELQDLKIPTEKSDKTNERLDEILDPNEELERLRRHFSKLKFNCVELETKHSFLNELINLHTLESPTEEQLEREKISYNEQKVQEKQLKMIRKQRKKEAKQIIEELANINEQFKKSKDQLIQRIEQTKEELYEQSQKSSTNLSLKKQIALLKKRVSDQNDEISQLKTEFLNLEKEIKQLNQKKQNLTAKKFNSKNDLKNLGQISNPNLVNTPIKKDHQIQSKIQREQIEQIKHISEWYTNINSVLSRLSSSFVVSVEEKNQRKIVIKLKTHTSQIPLETVQNKLIFDLSKEHLVQILFSPNSNQIQQVQVSPDSFPFEDIVTHSKQLKGDQGIKFLIRELKQRIYNYQKRKQEILQISKNTRIKSNKTAEKIQIDVQNVSLRVQMDHDYPSEYSCVNLLTNNDFPQQIIKVFGHEGKTLTDCILEVKEIIQK
ncbi:hypothetical protein M0813_04955 [Anaeramoeba flamelloides]|uniref:Spc7 kinetochore protein domain-containing protein n=1 Tax=Anaeramoeba flamelloides TaxID=1746091 RepID=A0ABQ8XIF2_9EUKA|nr:hypothetical protein M0813_04955 [Anaeramoeba flamelloides]